MTNKKIEIRIPNNYCDVCETINEETEEFEEFSQEMISFIKEKEYLNRDFTCDQCENKISKEPITLIMPEICKICSLENPILSFCSKECAIKFIEDKIDTKNRKENIKKMGLNFNN
jgi:hypothetical protein